MLNFWPACVTHPENFSMITLSLSLCLDVCCHESSEYIYWLHECLLITSGVFMSFFFLDEWVTLYISTKQIQRRNTSCRCFNRYFVIMQRKEQEKLEKLARKVWASILWLSACVFRLWCVISYMHCAVSLKILHFELKFS